MDFITSKEITLRLGISRTTLHKWAKSGKIVTKKLSDKKILYDADSIYHENKNNDLLDNDIKKYLNTLPSKSLFLKELKTLNFNILIDNNIISYTDRDKFIDGHFFKKDIQYITFCSSTTTLQVQDIQKIWGIDVNSILKKSVHNKLIKTVKNTIFNNIKNLSLKSDKEIYNIDVIKNIPTIVLLNNFSSDITTDLGFKIGEYYEVFKENNYYHEYPTDIYTNMFGLQDIKLYDTTIHVHYIDSYEDDPYIIMANNNYVYNQYNLYTLFDFKNIISYNDVSDGNVKMIVKIPYASKCFKNEKAALSLFMYLKTKVINFDNIHAFKLIQYYHHKLDEDENMNVVLNNEHQHRSFSTELNVYSYIEQLILSQMFAQGWTNHLACSKNYNISYRETIKSTYPYAYFPEYEYKDPSYDNGVFTKIEVDETDFVHKVYKDIIRCQDPTTSKSMNIGTYIDNNVLNNNNMYKAIEEKINEIEEYLKCNVEFIVTNITVAALLQMSPTFLPTDSFMNSEPTLTSPGKFMGNKKIYIDPLMAGSDCRILAGYNYFGYGGYNFNIDDICIKDGNYELTYDFYHYNHLNKYITFSIMI